MGLRHDFLAKCILPCHPDPKGRSVVLKQLMMNCQALALNDIWNMGMKMADELPHTKLNQI